MNLGILCIPIEVQREVGLVDSTQSVGKPNTRGSGQQYSIALFIIVRKAYRKAESTA
ncbi:hypothetical protein Wcon_02367 [Wolbachia endosymbiont of Cylisticus convexus]|nr:hypothetical protein Wcon_02367 [Wolbachia endosymbiont of Cylisticus convexus]